MTHALFAAAGRAAALGLVTVALVAGCSSTTSGSASSGKGNGGGSGFGNGGGTASASVAPGGGGGGAPGSGNFCHDWKTISDDLGHVSAGNVAQKLVARFDALAAEAPAAVKSDVVAIDQYVHAVLAHNVNPTKAQQVVQAFGRVGVWISQHC